MEFRLTRRRGLAVRDQLVLQIKRKILEGTLRDGARLPSVRALARRLDVHPKTVLAAYRNLAVDGMLTIRRGAGVTVGPPPTAGREGDRGLEILLSAALEAALRRGHTQSEIRAAVYACLETVAAERVVVTDPSRATAEILGRELGEVVGAPMQACALEEIERATRQPGRPLLAALPFYIRWLREQFPRMPIHVLRLAEPPPEVREVPRDGLALVVSHAARILPHAAALLANLHGDAIEIECCALAEPHRWGPLTAIATVVFADVVARPAVERHHPRRLVEFRLVSEASRKEVRRAFEGAAAEASTGAAAVLSRS